jgi:peptidoglycan hydrolase-like protein with peptidoglycan-binding domain
MNKNKNLLKLSIGLIIFNLFLGGGFFLNKFLNQSKYNEQSLVIEEKSKEVLGISTNIPQFSPNYIMSNNTFGSTRAFPNAEAIQGYLNSINSPLSKYEVDGRKAANIIYAASRGISSSQYGVTPNINPGVILAYLEKEQGLLSMKGYDTKVDPENRLKTAMGYGCPDNSKCDSEYFGFANQVKWAAYQLQYNYNNANKASFSHVVNKTVNTLDGYNVFLSNEATAANYRYTPHVYWGNYNLWKIITANGWGSDSSTWNQVDIDKVNISKIDTNEGFDTEKLKPEDLTSILTKNFGIGDSGGEIILLQRFLRQQGYFTYSEITGTFGNITKNALESYKKEKNISVVVDNDSECKKSYLKEWKIGQSGDEVKSLQECLRNDGTFIYPISTGYFGPLTQASLEKTRAKNGQIAPIPEQKPIVSNCDTLKSQAWQYGERSENVKVLQECLRQVKLFSYPENTGYFGPLTQDALNKWKTPVVVNQPPVAQGCDQIKTQTFTYGEKSDRVSALQKCMKDAGVFTWPYITGYFGSVTQESYSKWKNREVPKIDCSELKKSEWIFGEQGDRVKQLQACMRQAGTFQFSSDTGYFGEVTKQAIIKWRGYF